MIKRRNIRALVDEHIKEAGGDLAVGLSSFCTQVEEAIETEGITLADVSMKQLFEAMVDRDGSLDYHSTQDVSEAMTSAGFPTIVGQLIHPRIQQEFEPYAKTVADLTFEVDSNRKTENHVGFGSTDSFELVRENTMYEEAQILERVANISNYKYGKIISVTMEMVMFDQTNQVLTRARNIGKKGGQHYHRFVIERACDIAANALNESTSQGLVVDGTRRSMYENDHSAWDYVANDNLNGTALGDTGLEEAIILLSKMQDDKGDVIMTMPDVLLVPVALEATAKKLLGSPLQYNTSNNAINPYQNAFKIISSVYIDSGASATAWWLGDFKSQLLTQWVYRMRTEANNRPSQKSFDSDVVAQFKAGYFVGVGNTDYRYVVKGNA